MLRVHQGKKYVDWLWKRDGEKTCRDVRRRLLRDGYDGVRIEYDCGVVDHVAFCNRNIMPVEQQQCVANRNDSSNSLRGA